MEIRFLGHAAFSLSDGDTTVLVDPFLTGNPKAAASAGELEADAILLTHGHADHYGDVVDIAKRTGATVVAHTEIAGELSGQARGGPPRAGPEPRGDGGAAVGQRAARAGLALLDHARRDGLAPAGLVIELGGKRIYHLGDTALFSDLALPGRRGHIDVAIVPIGGHFTMDRFDAVVATQLLGADQVIPCHYDTFPPIETDAQAFKADVEQAGFAQVIVLAPGESHTP